MNLENHTSPHLSIVLPTLGSEKNLRRVLGSLVNNAPSSLLKVCELILFVNVSPESPVDMEKMELLIGPIKHLFYSNLTVCSDRYHLTAETSAFAAAQYATGEYFWIVGDKRVFLPEGLAVLDSFMRQPTAPCIYFNSVWFDDLGCTKGYPSTHMLSSRVRAPFKKFVMSQGINFMATNMGVWIFERRALDFSVWRQIIDRCGPHFSHVTALLHGLRGADVLCFSVFLSQMEAKAYHAGDDSEWAHYASVSNTYRFYAWTFGLVRQFKFLIENKIYSFSDVRRSICSESQVLSRQVDEIYKHLLAQIVLGRADSNEFIKPDEFEELMLFLMRACPEKVILNEKIRSLYESAATGNDLVFRAKLRDINSAIALDHQELRFSTMIIEQLGQYYVRLHPDGYLISKVTDQSDFMLAYKLLNPPKNHVAWRILTEDEWSSEAVDVVPIGFDEIWPPKVSRDSGPGSKKRRTIKQRITKKLKRVWLRLLRPR